MARIDRHVAAGQQHADAGLKGVHLPIAAARSFGKKDVPTGLIGQAMTQFLNGVA